MRFLNYLFLATILLLPINVFSGTVTQSNLEFMTTDESHDEVYALYDLRNRKTFIQVTRSDDNIEDTNLNPTLCIHVQIYQQDQGCSELNFEDSLTPNDSIIYDMDNLVRNDGSQVPVNLDDNSYGFVAISAFDCEDRDEGGTGDLLGNFRIIDDSGYEYRVNLITNSGSNNWKQFIENSPPPPNRANVIIPFNTVDGSNQADIFAFVVNDDARLDGSDDGPTEDLIYNEEKGITFDVFQIDENEERLSCDRKTIGCGPDIVFNYGINEDYPASRGDNLLCEGAGLLPGQQHGYISLENASFISSVEEPFDESASFDFACFYGLNNGNGTGSMEQCIMKCLFGTQPGTDGECEFPPG